MKKMVKAALAAALVCFSSSLFAAEPVSFLKSTTYDLFEDETVDNLAWGVEDADGLVLGGFNSSNYAFNIGAGAWLGDFWLSIYDTGSFYSDKTKVQDVTNDAVAKDGVNIDYVNSAKTTGKTRNEDDEIDNELYLSFSTGDWGIQSYWLYNNETASGDYGKKTEYTENKALGRSITTETKTNNYNGTNTFGAYFNGIGNDGDLYFNLKQFEVAWDKNSTKREISQTFKQNGATYTDTTTGFNTAKGKGIQSTNTITPRVVGEMGFVLPDLGSLSTKLVLVDDFQMGIHFSKEDQTATIVVEDVNSKATEKVTAKLNDKVYLPWENTLTPQFVFDFDAGERVSVKAKAGLGIKLSGETISRPNTTTTITESTTYNKATKLTTKIYDKKVSYNDPDPIETEFLEKGFTTELTPKTDLAIVYQVKPGKFNLNLGTEWTFGTFTWDTTTRTKAAVKESHYTETTNSAGEKTVTTDSVTYTNKGDDTSTGDAVKESKTTKFTADPASVALNIGATWFINEKVTLDLAYANSFGNLNIFGVYGYVPAQDSTGENGWTNSFGLLSSSIKLQFSIKF